MQIGDTVGRYRLLDVLGRGGMGEVYLAEDSDLRRQVAIKALTARLAGDPERLARLRREARLLASLNHPNIAVVYGLEEHEGLPLLIMERVEGETLGERLKRGPPPLAQALRIALQIARALEAAHERGVIHRDLKPSNVMIGPGGRVKLLDFGLARRDHTRETTDELATRDVVTKRGQMPGTLPYMSPEQVRGRPVDQRSDIWAFGCVLYELLLGQRAFSAPTPSDLTATILEHEPEWSGLDRLPWKIRDLVKRCLRKELDDRLHDIADGRIEIEEELAKPSSASRTIAAVPAASASRWIALMVVIVAAVGVALVYWARRPDTAPAEPVRRFSIGLPSGTALAVHPDYPSPLAVSPRGDAIAFVATSEGERRIFVRAFDEAEPRLVAGTEGAQGPFFSPDGAWVGFFADGKLKKVSLRGGAPVDLCDAPFGMGGAWSPDGWIVLAPSDSSGLMRVPESGGTPEPFTQVRLDEGEQGHWSPTLLPDGRTVLFTVWTGGLGTASRIAVRGVDDAGHRVVLEGGSHAAYLASGQLVYGRATSLLAVPFNPATASVVGTPYRVTEEVQESPGMATPVFSVSLGGVLTYAPLVNGGSVAGRIVWLDRSGGVAEELEAGHAYYLPRVAADGSRIAYHFAQADFDVWVGDLARGVRSRLTRDGGWDAMPVWSPGGDRIVFASARDGSRTLFLRRADGLGGARRLLPPGNPRWPTSWSADGASILYHEEDVETGLDVWRFYLPEAQLRPLVRTRAQESWARFSPDDRWIAYQSDESGRPEVYVRSSGEPARRMQVSIDGGIQPIWAPDGGGIYYLGPHRLWSVDVDLSGEPTIGEPEVVFELSSFQVNDVHPDGDRFLAVEKTPPVPVQELEVVLGWSREVMRAGGGQ